MRKNVFCVIIVVCILFCSCSKSTVTSGKTTISDESYLVGWYVDEGIVHIVCRLILLSDTNKSVTISAISLEDSGVLLKDENLIGYNEDMTSTEFELSEGRNDVIAVFIGEEGVKQEKADYDVPDEIIITEIKR